MLIERGADSDPVGPAGNQVEHAGRSQVNVMPSSNSGIDRIAAGDYWEGERFRAFPVFPDPRRPGRPAPGLSYVVLLAIAPAARAKESSPVTLAITSVPR